MRHPLEVTREMNHRDVPRRQTPQDRPATTPCSTRRVLAMHGNPSGGTIELSIDDGDVLVTVDYDMMGSDVETAIAAAAAAVPITFSAPFECTGGPLPNNDVIITVPRPHTIIVNTNSLTPTSIVRYADMNSCCGAN